MSGSENAEEPTAGPSATQAIRSLGVGECYTQGLLVHSLADGETQRLRLQNKLKTLAHRAAKATGHTYATTTVKQPVFDSELFVAAVVKRTR